MTRINRLKYIELPDASLGRRGNGQMTKRWYSVSVLSNFEKKIAEAIRQAAIDAGLSDEIDEVQIGRAHV